MALTALAVGLDPETRSRVVPRFAAHGLTLDVVDRAEDGAALASSRRFEVVTCSYPLPDMVLRRFGAAVRASGSASHDAALLVLTLRDLRSEAKLGLPHGRSLVCARNEPAAALNEAIGHLLRVAPRHPVDSSALLEIDALAGHAVAPRAVNLSRSGLLVAHPEPLPTGLRCRVTLLLDEGADLVCAEAEVVRQAESKHERLAGFALRFVDLDTSTTGRLDAWLAALA